MVALSGGRLWGAASTNSLFARNSLFPRNSERLSPKRKSGREPTGRDPVPSSKRRIIRKGHVRGNRRAYPYQSVFTGLPTACSPVDAAKLSQKAFATAMNSSQSRIAKAEANDATVSLDLLIRSLIALGVTLGEMGKILGFDENNSNVESSPTSLQLKRKALKPPRKNQKRSTVKAA